MTDRGPVDGGPVDGGVARRSGVAGFLAKVAGTLVLIVLAILLLLWGAQRYVAHRLSPDPVTIASGSLEGLREQNRLSAFAARFVAVVTSKQSALGFSTERTLIMPGMVRYEVDLARLNQRDVRWDAAAHRLLVTLPPIEVDGPEVDMAAIRSYGSGGVLAAVTNAGATLDDANRRAGQAELLRQARAAPMIALAREASRRAIERSFAMPLRAAGLDASVRVRFADEPAPASERWDVTRPIDEVLRTDEPA